MAKTVEYIKTVTVASGVASQTMSAFLPIVHSGSTIDRVVITPPTANSEYDVALVNASSEDVWNKKGCLGTIMEIPEVRMPLGVYSIEFSEASDGDYAVSITFKVDW